MRHLELIIESFCIFFSSCFASVADKMQCLIQALLCPSYLCTMSVSWILLEYVRVTYTTSNLFKYCTYKYQLVRENNFSLSLKLLFEVCFPV